MAKIEIRNLFVKFAERDGKSFSALGGVSAEIAAGEFVCIVGSSGCGKSTLLSAIGGLLKPSAGGVYIDGKKVRKAGTDRGFVFQHDSLFPWMTARANIAFGLSQAKIGGSSEERDTIANEFLGKVGLPGVGDKYPQQLSGGMQQRVAIARALAMDTEILLMDEPFGALDAKNRAVLQELLLELWEGGDDGRGASEKQSENPQGKGGKKTVLFVTHDVDEALLLSDRIIMLSNSPGKVEREFIVPFARPRHRAELALTKEYLALRSEILALFFHDVAEKIGGDEVAL